MKSLRSDAQFYVSFTDLLALLLVFFIYLTAMNATCGIRQLSPSNPLDPGLFQPVDTVQSAKELQDVILRVQEHVLFSVGGTDLSVSAKRALNELVQVVLKHPVRLVISGHADPTPISRSVIQSNWHLSALRSASVANYLVSMGIPTDHVLIAAHGATLPQSAKNHALNRRVEIRLEAL
jgi:flagellar motor protein MotB